MQKQSRALLLRRPVFARCRELGVLDAGRLHSTTEEALCSSSTPLELRLSQTSLLKRRAPLWRSAKPSGPRRLSEGAERHASQSSTASLTENRPPRSPSLDEAPPHAFRRPAFSLTKSWAHVRPQNARARRARTRASPRRRTPRTASRPRAA